MTGNSTFSDARATVNETVYRPASFACLGLGAPQLVEPGGCATWIARGANFVVALTFVEDSQEIIQADIPDESILLLSPAVPITIHADGKSTAVDDEAVAILPPGATRLVARGTGAIVRIFSTAASAMAALAGNATDYAGGADDVAPLVYWPDPIGGFRLRVYRLSDHTQDVGFGRLFRSTNLMVNIFEPAQAARDLARLSPHDHADFEQGSLTLHGDFIHYLRTPWGADSRQWISDRIIQCSGFSLIVIPPKTIHTTSWSSAGARLVDIFSPPREDFSRKPAWVRNAADYPMPGEDIGS
jgi:hypothetical protein